MIENEGETGDVNMRIGLIGIGFMGRGHLDQFKNARQGDFGRGGYRSAHGSACTVCHHGHGTRLGCAVRKTHVKAP